MNQHLRRSHRAIFVLLGVLFVSAFSVLAFVPQSAFAALAPVPTVQEIKSGNVTLDRILQSVPTEKEAKTQTAEKYMEIIYPKDYQANQEITLTLKCYAIEIQRAYISWYVDGKLLTSGYGKTKIKVKVKGPGVRTSVRAVAKPIESDIGIIEKTLVLYPTKFDVLWETDGYTPPFYKGKAPITVQSPVKFVALTDFADTPGSNLLYKWEKNFQEIGDGPQYGKNVIYLNGRGTAQIDGNRTARFDVNVSTLDNSAASSRILKIKTHPQEIIFYENNPVNGVMHNHAIKGALEMTKKTFKMIAEPYFFSKADLANESLKFNWTIDGRNHPEYKQNIAFEQKNAGNGTAYIKLAIQNIKNVYQSATSYLTVNFNNTDVN